MSIAGRDGSTYQSPLHSQPSDSLTSSLPTLFLPRRSENVGGSVGRSWSDHFCLSGRSDRGAATRRAAIWGAARWGLGCQRGPPRRGLERSRQHGPSGGSAGSQTSRRARQSRRRAWATPSSRTRGRTTCAPADGPAQCRRTAPWAAAGSITRRPAWLERGGGNAVAGRGTTYAGRPKEERVGLAEERPALVLVCGPQDVRDRQAVPRHCDNPRAKQRLRMRRKRVLRFGTQRHVPRLRPLKTHRSTSGMPPCASVVTACRRRSVA